jgi:uncharacterized protein YjbI with pentapeptide repeats
MPRAVPTPQEPRLPRELGLGEVAELHHDATVSEIELADVALVDQRANGVSFAAVRLSNVDLSGSHLDHLRIADGTLLRCNLANVRARNASITRVAVEGSRITGLTAPRATLRDLTLRDCRIDLASFGYSRLERVTFEDCLLGQSDFLEAQLEAVRFYRCDLTRADFRGARLKHCEFRRSNLTGLEGVESLRGAAMEWPDIVEMAGTFAATLGIGILDAD